MIASICIYFIKASMGMVSGWLGYVLFLQRIPQFFLRRAFLLAMLALGVFLPCCDFSFPVTSSFSGISTEVQAWEDGLTQIIATPAWQGPAFAQGTLAQPWPLSVGQLLLCIYGLGMGVSLILFVRQLLPIVRQVLKSPLYRHEAFSWLIPHPGRHTYSFGPFIFFSQQHASLSPEHRRLILEHERIHIRQGHTFDLMAIRLLQVAFWPIPIWKGVLQECKALHEYLVDRQMTHKVAPATYARLLLQLAMPATPSMWVHPFAYSPLKSRLNMLFQPACSPWKRLWLLPASVLPALFGLGLTFSPNLVEKQVVPVLENPLGISWQPVQDTISRPHLSPVEKPVVLATFGDRMHPILKVRKHHDGIDLKVPLSTAVFATARGKVIRAGRPAKGNYGGYGILVEIRHGAGYLTRYTHLSNTLVEVGDTVEAGQLIAQSGNTGLSTHPHLHYEVLAQGEPVDPLLFFPQGMKVETRSEPSLD